jgi:hypothetical protein
MQHVKNSGVSFFGLQLIFSAFCEGRGGPKKLD